MLQAASAEPSTSLWWGRVAFVDTGIKFVEQVGLSEVNHRRSDVPLAAIDQDVFSVEISVDNAASMESDQGAGEVLTDGDHLARRERLLQKIRRPPTLTEAHRDEGPSALGAGPAFDERWDRRVFDGAEDPGLSVKSLPLLGVPQHVVPKNLQRDDATGVSVIRQVNLGLGADPEELD